MTSTHLAICIRKFLVHFEPKVRINVVGRAKPLQKWLKIGQLMAIFSHKWLMLWPKNHIFINISWHGSCGPLLSSFEVLEVPKTDKSSIVWRHHSKSPVPLDVFSFWQFRKMWNCSIFLLLNGYSCSIAMKSERRNGYYPLTSSSVTDLHLN